jgi:hypothetical protein
MHYRILFQVTVFVTLSLSILTPPTIFAHMDFMSRDIRTVLALTALFLIFLNYKRPSMTLFEWYVVFLVLMYYVVEIVEKKSSINNVLSFYIVIIISIFLYHILNQDNHSKYIYLNIWIYLGYFLSISVIMVFIIHQFTQFDTDYLNLEALMDYSNRNYRFSFFGVSQAKDYKYFSIARSSGFFPESQYAAFYFMINIMIGRFHYVRERYKKWSILNLFAGILTFSTMFYITIICYYSLVYISKINLNYRNLSLAFGFMITLLFISLNYNRTMNILMDILSYTSYSDRMNRITNSLNIISNSSSVDLFFGHGVSYTGGADRGLSIGLFHLLVERGLIGLLMVLSIMINFIQGNRIVYFIFVLYLMAFTWYVNYIYWFGLLALWSATEADECRYISLAPKGRVFSER